MKTTYIASNTHPPLDEAGERRVRNLARTTCFSYAELWDVYQNLNDKDDFEKFVLACIRADMSPRYVLSKCQGLKSHHTVPQLAEEFKKRSYQIPSHYDKRRGQSKFF